MTFLTLDQLEAMGKKCAHCEKNATWIAHKDSPAYCDEHFPYYEEVVPIAFIPRSTINQFIEGKAYEFN